MFPWRHEHLPFWSSRSAGEFSKAQTPTASSSPVLYVRKLAVSPGHLAQNSDGGQKVPYLAALHSIGPNRASVIGQSEWQCNWSSLQTIEQSAQSGKAANQGTWYQSGCAFQSGCQIALANRAARLLFPIWPIGQEPT